jgi:quercetin dioxygenase-like cupin family protein
MSYFYRWAEIPEEVHASQNIKSDRITRKFIVGEKGMSCLFRFKDPMTMKAHKHPHEQFSCIQFGRFRFRVGGVEREVGPGDVVHIPGNVEHGYDVLEPDSVDLEFYSPVREDFLGPAKP